MVLIYFCIYLPVYLFATLKVRLLHTHTQIQRVLEISPSYVKIELTLNFIIPRWDKEINVTSAENCEL